LQKSHRGKKAHNTPIPAAVGRTAATTLTTPLIRSESLLHNTTAQLSPASQAVPAGRLTALELKERKKQQGRDAMRTRSRRSSSSSQHDRFTDHRRTDALPYPE